MNILYMTLLFFKTVHFYFNIYNVARTTVLKWVHSDGFSAYNLCGHWYVDVDKFYIWRERQHKKSYKYA